MARRDRLGSDRFDRDPADHGAADHGAADDPRMRSDRDPPAAPDVEIGASARFRRLRLGERPRADVRLHGEIATADGERDELELEAGDERSGLPDELEPGVTYRDGAIGWRATGRLRRRDDAEAGPDGQDAGGDGQAGG